MGIFDKLFGELVDIVEWVDDTRDTMVYRFQRYNNQIKYGAKLIVRESQMAAFVNEGSLTDLFLFPGTYTLETKNLPLLSTAQGWKYGFNSPFKSEVYFVSMRTFTDRKWGTKNPIMLRDPEYGPVRLRAFGSFAIQVSDPATFLKQVVGTSGRFSVEQIGEQLRDMVVSRFADVLGESKIPILDLASNYDELGKFITTRIEHDFDQFGLKVAALYVENISLPPEVEAALDKRTSMGIIGNLQAYTQYQAATAMQDAAKNPGGLSRRRHWHGNGHGHRPADHAGRPPTAAAGCRACVFCRLACLSGCHWQLACQCSPSPATAGGPVLRRDRWPAGGPVRHTRPAIQSPCRRTDPRDSRLAPRHGPVDPRKPDTGAGIRLCRHAAAPAAKVVAGSY